jgi:signal transduction histidine kinase
MTGEARTDFLPKSGDLDREPINIDLKKPEVTDWAEMTDLIDNDPELKSELESSLDRAARRNSSNPKVIQTIMRIGATLGLTIAVLAGAKFISENKESGPDYKPTENSAEIDPTQQQQEAIAGMEQQNLQEDAQKYLSELQAKEAAQERERISAEITSPTIPETVVNQNFDGLDTTNIE